MCCPKCFWRINNCNHSSPSASKNSLLFVFLLFLLFLPALSILQASPALSAQTIMVSISTGGTQANDSCYETSVSSGGKLVSFHTRASNLAGGDSDGDNDVYVRDVAGAETKRASPAEGNSRSSVVSGDGRFIAFESSAPDLVTGDTNLSSDVFLYTMETGAITRISVDSEGNQGSVGGGSPSISSDGRYIAFASGSSNLVDGDTNGRTDIFVRDRQTGQTSLVSVNSNEEQASYHCYHPSISADGRYVAFHSRASNLDTPDNYDGDDVFLRDRQAGETIMVSVDSNGNQGNDESNNASISADGRYVAFQSEAKLVPGDTDSFDDVYVYDRITGLTVCASVDSEGNHDSGDCYYPAISANGRYVAFAGGSNDLVPGDTNGKTDIFVHDLRTGLTIRASVDSSGNQGNGTSSDPSISPDGRYVAFRSDAINLVAVDTNGKTDIFLHGPIDWPGSQAVTQIYQLLLLD
jgi:Tol biopolymer transport system component